MFERTPNIWEVPLLGGGKTITEKVRSFWDPAKDGVKADIATAARCKATIRHKGNPEFGVVSEPVLLGKADKPGGVVA